MSARPWQVVTAIGGVALLVGAAAWQTQAWTEPEATIAALGPHMIAWAVLWLALTYLPPRAGDGWKAALVVLGVAAAARLAMIGFTEPVLSDDLWRYLHDGYTLGVLGQNPYALAPAESNPLALPINHPDLVTIYQPVSQWVFAGFARLAVEEQVFRLGFVMVDLAIVAVLVIALRRAKQSPWLAALYGWHPLAITETAGSGHQDVLGILPLLGAVLLLGAGRSRTREIVAGAGLMAFAVAVKSVVLPLVLPMAWSLRRRPRDLAAAVAVGAAILALLYVPFALMPGGLNGLVDTGRTFVDIWAFNGSVHPLLVSLLGDRATASCVCAAALLGLLVLWTVRDLPLAHVAMLYLFAALLLSSTVHPWYVLWPLAFVPLVRGRGAMVVWVMSLMVVLAYTAHVEPSGKPYPWAVWLEYAVVDAAVAAAALWPRRRLAPVG